MDKRTSEDIKKRIEEIELLCQTPHKLPVTEVPYLHTELAAYMSTIDEWIEKAEKLYASELIAYTDVVRREHPSMSMMECEKRFVADGHTKTYSRLRLMPKRVSKLIDSLKKLQTYNELEQSRIERSPNDHV